MAILLNLLQFPRLWKFNRGKWEFEKSKKKTVINDPLGQIQTVRPIKIIINIWKIILFWSIFEMVVSTNIMSHIMKIVGLAEWITSDLPLPCPSLLAFHFTAFFLFRVLKRTKWALFGLPFDFQQTTNGNWVGLILKLF